MKKQEPETDRSRMLKNMGLFYVIVGDLVGYVGAGTALGYFAWKKWDAPMWVMFVTSLVGFVLAMVQIVRVSQLANRDSNKGEKQ